MEGGPSAQPLAFFTCHKAVHNAVLGWGGAGWLGEPLLDTAAMQAGTTHTILVLCKEQSADGSTWAARDACLPELSHVYLSARVALPAPQPAAAREQACLRGRARRTCVDTYGEPSTYL